MRSAAKIDVVQLLADARRGRADCLGRLLELYRNYLNLLARTQIDLHLRGRVDPSDVVQEAFLEASRDFAQFRGGTEAELIGWLRRILLFNLAQIAQKHTARKRDSRRESSLDRGLRELDESAAQADAALVAPCGSPSAHASRREQAAILADHLARLPADYREVIVLRNLEGLSFDEVAQRLGRSPGAVRMLWMRALQRLRGQLKGEDLI
jgi:RNA polymerase sigma-70 factor (ECF subfamily)